MTETTQFIIYADGSCKRNPGPGAAAVVITTPGGAIVKEFVRAFRDTTNNRMELIAVISALKAVPRGDIRIVTDSQYVVKGITGWITSWKAKGWLTAQRQPVLNKDLWQELDALASAHVGTLTWQWTRGHAGTPGNERADALAQQAAEEFCAHAHTHP
ncbi:MAG TPA: ribonuclease HI [Armatimonadota bacterium]|nr:ribonuclease HI [Armatimonadota bacterium]